MLDHSRTLFLNRKLGQIKDPVLKNGVGVGYIPKIETTALEKRPLWCLVLQGGKLMFGWVPVTLKSAKGSHTSLPKLEASAVAYKFKKEDKP